jgi:DNA-damage-inducible protein D
LNKELIGGLNKSFEDSAFETDGVEYWLARDLQVLLEYTQWRNFEQVIEKAKVSCQTAGQNPSHHFAGVSKTIPMPKGAEKAIDDYMLTRYAARGRPEKT